MSEQPHPPTTSMTAQLPVTEELTPTTHQVTERASVDEAAAPLVTIVLPCYNERDHVIDEVERGEANVILFGLCGHGHFDLAAYDAYLSGTLEDPEFSEADMEAALARLPEAPAIA